MYRKAIRIFLSLLMITSILALSACGSTQEQKPAAEPQPTEATPPQTTINIIGSGTEEDPWCVGADKPEDVTVTVFDGNLWVNGTGDMMDFESAEQRPWNDIIGDLTNVCFGDEVSHVGALAFMGAGKNASDFDLGFYCDLKSIGDRAFEGVNFADYSIPTVPESVESIGARAFADSTVQEIYIDGTPEIADDAFSGVKARVCVRNNGIWNNSNMLGYGGELDYVYTYEVRTIDDYGTEDITGEGTIYCPADMDFEYDAASYVGDEEYHFVRYEVLSGDLALADPTDPLISARLTGNVELKIIYEHN